MFSRVKADAKYHMSLLIQFISHGQMTPSPMKIGSHGNYTKKSTLAWRAMQSSTRTAKLGPQEPVL